MYICRNTVWMYEGIVYMKIVGIAMTTHIHTHTYHLNCSIFSIGDPSLIQYPLLTNLTLK